MNKKRSNEYGFTLIELLVAIAIMLSITVLAIVNIVGVSNRKKEEAWQSVKEEIETAATDYFKANEYLFEGLEDENHNTGYISVGKLVNDDYLNKVTDPRSGKAVSYCTLVYIKKSGRSVSVTKIEESTLESCYYESVVTVSNAKNAPKIVEMVPIDRMLIETDAPYLAPEPVRGTRNDSSNLKYIVEKIAEFKGTSPEKIAKITYENAERLFIK